MEPPLWNEGASAFPHEREALAFLKARLPDHEPYRVWTNVVFLALSLTPDDLKSWRPPSKARRRAATD